MSQGKKSKSWQKKRIDKTEGLNTSRERIGAKKAAEANINIW